MNWIYEGRAWFVGDDVGIDSHVMTLRAVRERIWDPEVLAGMIFEESFPEITAQAQPGDIIVAGRRFAHGNPHVNGWIGMRARGLGVVCSSIARGGFRNAINAGTALLVGQTSLTEDIADGESIRVDFERGVVELAGGRSYRFEPLPPELREIVELGGSQGWMRKQLSEATG